MAPIEIGSCWIDPIEAHLETNWNPDDAMEARRLFVRALRYVLIDVILYRRSFVIPYMRFLKHGEARLALKEVHEEICGQHTGGRAFACNITRLGF